MTTSPWTGRTTLSMIVIDEIGGNLVAVNELTELVMDQYSSFIDCIFVVGNIVAQRTHAAATMEEDVARQSEASILISCLENFGNQIFYVPGFSDPPSLTKIDPDTHDLPFLSPNSINCFQRSFVLVSGLAAVGEDVSVPFLPQSGTSENDATTIVLASACPLSHTLLDTTKQHWTAHEIMEALGTPSSTGGLSNPGTEGHTMPSTLKIIAGAPRGLYRLADDQLGLAPGSLCGEGRYWAKIDFTRIPTAGAANATQWMIQSIEFHALRAPLADW